jgi:hypothetical protein
MSKASLSEGLYFPFSRNTMVSRLTPTFLASSTCVKSFLARSSFILLFIPHSNEFHQYPAKHKYHGHAYDANTNDALCVHLATVRKITY